MRACLSLSSDCIVPELTVLANLTSPGLGGTEAPPGIEEQGLTPLARGATPQSLLAAGFCSPSTEALSVSRHQLDMPLAGPGDPCWAVD